MRPLRVLLLIAAAAGFAPGRSFDVVVYGGTESGAMAAIAAARAGASVALIEPGRFLGGLTTGGRGSSLPAEPAGLAGPALEFFARAGRRYGKPAAWSFEPHAGSAVLLEMIREARVEVFLEHRLRQERGVRRGKGRVRRILMENGAVFEARVFLDCTYEADLAARAGAAGAFSPDAPAAGGDASFTLCLTARPDNQVPFPKPSRYDADRYLPVLELLEREAGRLGRPLRMDEALIVRPLPGGKVLANHLPLGGYLGAGREYLAADYGRRAQIWQEHIDYTAGLYYFLAHDPRMPGSLREEIGRFGLAADEFAYSNHWPHQLYIRESRPPGAELENLLVPAWLARRRAPASGLRGEVLPMTLGQLAGAAAKSLTDGSAE